MNLTFWQVFAPVAGLFINVVVQVLSLRRITSLLKSVYAGFGAGFISLFIYELRDPLILFVTNLLIYSALGYCYFHFINLGETARRIRILRELYQSKNGLTMEEILARYNAKEIFGKRVSRLIKNGQIISKEGRYYIGNSVMLFIARIMTAMKLIILGKGNWCKI